MSSLLSWITFGMKINATSDFTLHFPQQFVDCFAHDQCYVGEGLKTASVYPVVQHAVIVLSSHFKKKTSMFTFPETSFVRVLLLLLKLTWNILWTCLCVYIVHQEVLELLGKNLETWNTQITYCTVPIRFLGLNDTLFIKLIFSTSSEDILQNFLALLCCLYIQDKI